MARESRQGACLSGHAARLVNSLRRYNRPQLTVFQPVSLHLDACGLNYRNWPPAFRRRECQLGELSNDRCFNLETVVITKNSEGAGGQQNVAAGRPSEAPEQDQGTQLEQLAAAEPPKLPSVDGVIHPV